MYVLNFILDIEKLPIVAVLLFQLSTFWGEYQIILFRYVNCNCT
ncbi:hypothetical protein SAMN05444416_10280 [Thermoactinomyces sp. DSM 45892]|nr:hypothetical protein SAMN05444416_10280 [Thermoactinomyces sp. DSM 45892]